MPDRVRGIVPPQTRIPQSKACPGWDRAVGPMGLCQVRNTHCPSATPAERKERIRPCLAPSDRGFAAKLAALHAPFGCPCSLLRCTACFGVPPTSLLSRNGLGVPICVPSVVSLGFQVPHSQQFLFHPAGTRQADHWRFPRLPRDQAPEQFQIVPTPQLMPHQPWTRLDAEITSIVMSGGLPSSHLFCCTSAACPSHDREPRSRPPRCSCGFPTDRSR